VPTDSLAVRCRALVKSYDGGVVAVDGLDLEIATGECFGLLGPNGAGKTTTVEILEGLLAPSAGDVEVLGMRWGSQERALRERIGVSLQQTHLPDRLSVSEILEMFRALYVKRRDVADLLAVVALEDKKKAHYQKLSGGQKQRLAVACALAGDPDLLFLDEPTTGLDPQSRLQLWDVVQSFKSKGRTVLLTTHYMDEAERLCDRRGLRRSSSSRSGARRSSRRRSPARRSTSRAWRRCRRCTRRGGAATCGC
jgi:ABC-2 type transport system ATP-binding protein